MKTNKARKHSSPLLKEILDRIPPVDKEKIGNKMIVAARIHEYMKEAGMNNIELARQLSKNPSVITTWLSGTHNFTIDTLTEIACALNVTLVDLHFSKQEVINEPAEITFNIIDSVEIKPTITPWYDPAHMPTFSLMGEPEISYSKPNKYYA